MAALLNNDSILKNELPYAKKTTLFTNKLQIKSM